MISSTYIGKFFFITNKNLLFTVFWGLTLFHKTSCSNTTSFLQNDVNEELKYEHMTYNTLQICLNVMFNLEETRNLIVNYFDPNRQINSLLLKCQKNNTFHLTDSVFNEIKIIMFPRTVDPNFILANFSFIELFFRLFEKCYIKEIEIKNSANFNSLFLIDMEVLFQPPNSNRIEPYFSCDNGEYKIIEYIDNKFIPNIQGKSGLKQETIRSYTFTILPKILFVKIRKENINSLIQQINGIKDKKYTRQLQENLYECTGIIVESKDEKNTFFYEIEAGIVYINMNNFRTKSELHEIISKFHGKNCVYTGLFKKID